jgi:hypothetical protein
MTCTELQVTHQGWLLGVWGERLLSKFVLFGVLTKFAKLTPGQRETGKCNNGYGIGTTVAILPQRTVLHQGCVLAGAFHACASYFHPPYPSIVQVAFGDRFTRCDGQPKSGARLADSEFSAGNLLPAAVADAPASITYPYTSHILRPAPPITSDYHSLPDHALTTPPPQAAAALTTVACQL